VATTFNKLNTNQAGVDLGVEESFASDQSSGGSRDASASITFNTNGTVTFGGVGVSTTNTSPATNWNTNGGTHLSYETILNSADNGSATVTGDLANSSFLGETRHSLASNFVLNAVSTWPSGGPTTIYESTVRIKVSIWDAAVDGRRTAYGEYVASAVAGSST